MLSTSTKIAFGYIIVIALMFGAIGYIYEQMSLLTEPTGLEENINDRRRTTHNIITKLYETEVIGQALRVGKSHEYRAYSKAMKEVHLCIDTLQSLLTDTLQKARLDTVRTLLYNKSRNMIAVMEAMQQTPTDQIYREQLDSMLQQHDSLINKTQVKRRVITRHNTYTIRHERKGFFRRVADVFSPGKADSTEVNNVIQEEYTDTIDEAYNPIDTLASMLSGIQHKVFQTRQDELKTLSQKVNNLKIAGSKLSQRVNQLLESIEKDEQEASEKKILQEQAIRSRAAWTMASISVLALVLVLVFFAIIWRDLTKSNHYRRELEKAKSYAENLLVAREKLMLTITHDIKAPAGSIIGYIDLLVRLVEDKRQQFYLSNMKSSAQHLLALVTSLLDYHRLEAGKMDLNPVLFKPYQLFEDIYNCFLPLARQKNLTINLELNISQTLKLEGDPFRIRQIVENLISNALKFTSEGYITINAEYKGNQFTFKVKDTGHGMNKEEQQRIFKEFTRLRSAQGQEGFGLGLSITQKLVELLNGKITIESEVGKGSTFTVSIPLPSYTRKDEPAVEIENTQKVESIEAKANLTENKVINGNTFQQSGNPDIDAANKEMANVRVLIIDDDKIQMQLTEAIVDNVLSSDEYVSNSNKPYIRCCEHPEELFALLNEDTFDIVFTDIQMPAMNGFQILEAIRKMPEKGNGNIPVVAITARGDLSDSDFISKGFAGMLQKPFNRNDMLNILSKVMSNSNNSNSNSNNNSISYTTKTNNTDITDNISDDNNNHGKETLNDKSIKNEFNFSPLTAFSMDDEDAAKEIISTFISETQKNIDKLKMAINEKDMKLLCNTAHKMLPTFTMIEAEEAISPLQWLENKRNTNEYMEEAEMKAHKIIVIAENVVQEAKRILQ